MFFSLILFFKNYNDSMEKRREFKNKYLIFSIVLSIIFLFLHQFHECEGDGCLICLFSLIMLFVTNALLLIKYVPALVEKIVIYIRTIYNKVLDDYNLEEEKKFTFNNPINNIQTTDLITFGVKIQ